MLKLCLQEKEAYTFLKDEIYQNYNTEENIKKRSYQSDNTDKPGYRYEFKTKIIKKLRTCLWNICS